MEGVQLLLVVLGPRNEQFGELWYRESKSDLSFRLLYGGCKKRACYLYLMIIYNALSVVSTNRLIALTVL